MANTQLIFPDGLKVDDASGQSSLNYYQEYTATGITFSGTSAVLGTGATATLSLARIGKIVTCRITPTVGTSPGSTNKSTSATNTVPPWAQPVSNVYLTTPWNFASNIFYFIVVTGNGALEVDARDFNTGTRVALDAGLTLITTIGSWTID